MSKLDILNDYINNHKDEVIDTLIKEDLKAYSINDLIEFYNLSLDSSKQDIKDYLRENYSNKDLLPLCIENKYIRSKAMRLREGTDYRKQAIKILVDSDICTEATATKIIDALYRQDIHAFNHAPAWLEKYLKGIARMLVEECKDNIFNIQHFLTECPNIFDQYLTWVKENREKVGTQIDNDFIQRMSYKDVKDKVQEIQDMIEQQSRDELSKMDFSRSSNYKLIPIDSFEELNTMFGGNATGDGTDRDGAYAGNGGTSWCHTNSKSTYDTWVEGKNKFFVLARDNWQDIPFNTERNYMSDGKDAYGNSLIAILVDKHGRLKNATLRCNHVGIRGSADNQYKSFAELSKIVGFNVEEAVKNEMPAVAEPKEETIEMFGKPCRIRHLMIDDEEQPDWYDFIDIPMLSKVYETIEQASNLRGNTEGLYNRKDNLLDGGPSARLNGGCKRKIAEELSKYFTVTSIHLQDKTTLTALYPNKEDRIKYWQGDPCEYWLFDCEPMSYRYWCRVSETGGIGIDAVDDTLGVACIFQIKIDD